MFIKMTFSCIVDEDGFMERPGYLDLVRSFEAEIIASTSEGSYDGDYFFVLKKGNEYGYLTFGYGSCSGCDALQACDTPEEVQALRDSLYNSIWWVEGKENFAKWLRERDWACIFESHYPHHKEFIRGIIRALE